MDVLEKRREGLGRNIKPKVMLLKSRHVVINSENRREDFPGKKEGERAIKKVNGSKRRKEGRERREPF